MTTDKIIKDFKKLREDIADQLRQKYKNITLVHHKYGIDIVYYTVFYSDGIKTHKTKRSISNKLPNLDSYYLTEQDAINAIEPFVPQAIKKFNDCLDKLKRLKNELDFDLGHCIYGDTHGIEDYPYLSFKLNGFSFLFTIEN